jgi:hypothetical protein
MATSAGARTKEVGVLQRSLRRALAVLALAGGVALPSLAAGAATKAATKCTHAALSPYVESARAASKSFIADLTKYGARSGTISTIAITLANGDKVNFTFHSGHFTLSGSGVPASCKAITSQDDWLG